MGDKMMRQKAYKSSNIQNISNLRIVSMIPGDREVAGCFNISGNLGVYNGRYLIIC